MSTTKEKDAKEFETVINAEIKTKLERLLDSVDDCSAFCGDRVFIVPQKLLGKRPAVLISNLLDANDIDFIESINGISVETRDYLFFLFAKYAYRIRGIISGELVRKPDEWIGIDKICTRYDPGKNESLLKLAIQKANKENFVIEDSYGAWLALTRFMLEYICERPKGLEIASLKINRNDVEAIKDLVSQLNGILTTAESLKKIDSKA